MLPQILNLAVKIAGGSPPAAAFHSSSNRRCCRCHLPLTDAASMEVGIGPICRKLDSALLARAIPSNVLKARESFELVDVTTLVPETVAVLLEVEAALLGHDALSVLDWRLTVKRIEWILSYSDNKAARPALMGVVTSLGYLGLAALWNGQAATGKSTLLLGAASVWFQGPQNSAGHKTLKKITGAAYHKNYTGPGLGGIVQGKPVWSFPLAQFPQVRLAVVTHWPNCADLEATTKSWMDPSPWKSPPPPSEALLNLSLEGLKSLPGTVSKPVETAKPVVPPPNFLVWVSDGLLHVRTPYNPDYVAELKTLPWAQRTWDGSKKAWRVDPKQRPFVTKLLKKYFNFEAPSV